jgi:nicotinamidase-related amidase
MPLPSEKSALLVLDVQPAIVARLPEPEAYLARVADAIGAARRKGLPVVYVVVGFRPGYPEVSARNKSFGALRTAGLDLTNPQPSLTPAAGEVVVVKRRISAFCGSDLEVVLRAQGIERLVLCGIATSGVVLSTLREAADKDYALTVLSDLCADFDPEVHVVLLGKVFPRQADVMTAEEWAQAG